MLSDNNVNEISKKSRNKNNLPKIRNKKQT